MSIEWEKQAYGMTEEQIKDWIDNAPSSKYHSPLFRAYSMLSDVQEIIHHGGSGEEARQLLNRAKFIMAEYYEDQMKTRS